MPQPWSLSRAAATALVIHAGMSADRSLWNSAGPRAASIVATVSGVTLFLPRYQRAESAAPAASPANCSRRRFEVWTILTVMLVIRMVRLDALVWNTGAVGTWVLSLNRRAASAPQERSATMNDVRLDPQQVPARAELLLAAELGEDAPGRPIYTRPEPDGHDDGEPAARIKVGAMLTRRLSAAEATETPSGAAYGNPLRGRPEQAPSVPIGSGSWTRPCAWPGRSSTPSPGAGLPAIAARDTEPSAEGARPRDVTEEPRRRAAPQPPL